MQQDLKEKIFSKIEKDQIHPIQATYFQNKNRLLWASVGMITIFGIFLAGFFWHDLSELFTTGYLMRGNMGFALIPSIFWMLLIVLLVYLAIVSITYTTTGYRRSHSLVIVMAIAIVIVGTFTFRWIGLGPQIHAFLIDHVPMISSIVYQASSWNDAEQGRLAGTIVSIDATTLSLKGLDGRIWNIKRTGFVSPMVLLEVDERIRILGKKTGDAAFESESIMPWFGKGMMRRGSGSGQVHGGGKGMMR